MKIGVIISSNDAETCWNALRYANFCTIEQAEKFLQSGGKILACGTCIKSRNQEATEMCPISTMKDMYEIVKESDKVVTF